MSKLDFFQRLDIYDINGDTVSKKTFNAIKELQGQNKILREALEFYADNSNWLGNGEIGYSDRLLAENKTKTNFLEFGGKRAREALAKVKK